MQEGDQDSEDEVAPSYQGLAGCPTLEASLVPAAVIALGSESIKLGKVLVVVQLEDPSEQ